MYVCLCFQNYITNLRFSSHMADDFWCFRGYSVQIYQKSYDVFLCISLGDKPLKHRVLLITLYNFRIYTLWTNLQTFHSTGLDFDTEHNHWIFKDQSNLYTTTKNRIVICTELIQSGDLKTATVIKRRNYKMVAFETGHIKSNKPIKYKCRKVEKKKS